MEAIRVTEEQKKQQSDADAADRTRARKLQWANALDTAETVDDLKAAILALIIYSN